MNFLFDFAQLLRGERCRPKSCHPGLVVEIFITAGLSMKKVGFWCKRKELVSSSEPVSLKTYLVRIQVEVGRLRRRKPESEERKQLTGCPMPNIPATL